MKVERQGVKGSIDVPDEIATRLVEKYGDSNTVVVASLTFSQEIVDLAGMLGVEPWEAMGCVGSILSRRGCCRWEANENLMIVMCTGDSKVK